MGSSQRALCPSQNGERAVHPWETPGGRAGRARAPRCPGPRRAARQRRRQVGQSVRAGPHQPPPAAPAPRAALTQASPAQRAVAAVEDRAELAQQCGRQVEQERVHRERAAGPAAPRRRRPGHGSVGGDQGPGRGGMRSPGLCTPVRCRYTTAEILLPRPRPRRQNTPSRGPGRGGPHMTQSATPQRCPRGRVAWPWGLTASAEFFTLA